VRILVEGETTLVRGDVSTWSRERATIGEGGGARWVNRASENIQAGVKDIRGKEGVVPGPTRSLTRDNGPSLHNAMGGVGKVGERRLLDHQKRIVTGEKKKNLGGRPNSYSVNAPCNKDVGKTMGGEQDARGRTPPLPTLDTQRTRGEETNVNAL